MSQLHMMDALSYLVRSVIHHQIHHKLHTPVMTAFDDLVDIGHCSEGWMNAFIIRDVISHIYLRRLVNGTYLDSMRKVTIHKTVEQILTQIISIPNDLI